MRNFAASELPGIVLAPPKKSPPDKSPPRALRRPLLPQEPLVARTPAKASGYDAFTYFGDAGAIFLTGTTEEAGWVGQGGVVLATPDDALRIALDVALGPRARMATPPAGS
ncbi:MAG: hypothetical protein IPH44_38570 [Myxococcales bacterium]|nr:hypothetical protein [Myxococcales bacterium]MBK7197631.1 hypothetical protein [Myxococcales bacterium]MBP6844515.1 hypothetical protein [Kofleriaceae bacterium]